MSVGDALAGVKELHRRVVEAVGPGAAAEDEAAVAVAAGRARHVGKADRVVVGIHIGDGHRAAGRGGAVFGYGADHYPAQHRRVVDTCNGDRNRGAATFRGPGDKGFRHLLASGQEISLGVIQGEGPIAAVIKDEVAIRADGGWLCNETRTAAVDGRVGQLTIGRSHRIFSHGSGSGNGPGHAATTTRNHRRIGIGVHAGRRVVGRHHVELEVVAQHHHANHLAGLAGIGYRSGTRHEHVVVIGVIWRTGQQVYARTTENKVPAGIGSIVWIIGRQPQRQDEAIHRQRRVEQIRTGRLQARHHSAVGAGRAPVDLAVVAKGDAFKGIAGGCKAVVALAAEKIGRTASHLEAVVAARILGCGESPNQFAGECRIEGHRAGIAENHRALARSGSGAGFQCVVTGAAEHHLVAAAHQNVVVAAEQR